MIYNLAPDANKNGRASELHVEAKVKALKELLGALESVLFETRISKKELEGVDRDMYIYKTAGFQLKSLARECTKGEGIEWDNVREKL